MKKRSKITAAVLAATLVITMLAVLTGCSGDKNKVYNIGICQLVQHNALDAATDGFKQALIDNLGEENVNFDTQNAQGDPNTCSTIVNSFVTKNVDLIMANGTAALEAAYNATQTIPILGTSITEYGAALDIKDFSGTVGGNVSGTSDLAPLTEQADMLMELVPDAKNVGLLYCSAEKNSAYQIDVVEEYLTSKGLTCTRYKFSDSNDVASVTTKAAEDSDVIYVPTDNTAAACVETIGNIVVDKKVPVIAGESGICTGCGIATLSISYYELGYKTGEMAAKILKGEANISEMPVEYVSAVKKYNPTICEELGVEIPDGYEALSE